MCSAVSHLLYRFEIEKQLITTNQFVTWHLLPTIQAKVKGQCQGKYINVLLYDKSRDCHFDSKIYTDLLALNIICSVCLKSWVSCKKAIDSIEAQWSELYCCSTIVGSKQIGFFLFSLLFSIKQLGLYVVAVDFNHINNVINLPSKASFECRFTFFLLGSYFVGLPRLMPSIAGRQLNENWVKHIQSLSILLICVLVYCDGVVVMY